MDATPDGSQPLDDIVWTPSQVKGEEIREEISVTPVNWQSEGSCPEGKNTCAKKTDRVGGTPISATATATNTAAPDAEGSRRYFGKKKPRKRLEDIVIQSYENIWTNPDLRVHQCSLIPDGINHIPKILYKIQTGTDITKYVVRAGEPNTRPPLHAVTRLKCCNVPILDREAFFADPDSRPLPDEAIKVPICEEAAGLGIVALSMSIGERCVVLFPKKAKKTKEEVSEGPVKPQNDIKEVCTMEATAVETVSGTKQDGATPQLEESKATDAGDQTEGQTAEEEGPDAAEMAFELLSWKSAPTQLAPEPFPSFGASLKFTNSVSGFETPYELCCVTIEFELLARQSGSTERWREVMSTYSSGLPHSFRIGEGEEMPGLERAVMKMKVGSEAQLKVACLYGCGGAATTNGIAAPVDWPEFEGLDISKYDKHDLIGKDLKFRRLRLVNIGEPEHRGNLCGDKPKVGEALLDLGNFHFKRGSYRRAVRRYEMAINAATLHRTIESVTDPSERNVVKRTLLNACQANLHLKNYEPAFAAADMVLSLDPINSKALFRKAIALKNLGRLSEAKIAIDEASYQEPKDTKVLLERALIIKALREETRETLKPFKKFTKPDANWGFDDSHTKEIEEEQSEEARLRQQEEKLKFIARCWSTPQR